MPNRLVLSLNLIFTGTIKVIQSVCFLVTCFTCSSIGEAFSQDQKVADSLTAFYHQNTFNDTTKLGLLKKISFNETRNLKTALEYADELIRLATKVHNDKYLRAGYFLKGTKKRLLGNLDEALDAFFKSGEVSKKIKSVTGEAEAYAAIADVYSVGNNHSLAMNYYKKAITTLRQSSQEAKVLKSLASTLLNVGDEFLKTKYYDSALVYFSEAKEIFQKVNYLTGKGYSLGDLGMVYASVGKNDLAEKNINEAILILQETEDYYPICDYLNSMADVYIKKENIQQALNYTLKSLRLAEQYGLKEQIAEASLKLSELNESTGDIRGSFQNYKKYIVYRDSINNLKMVQRMADVRTNYEVSQKQVEVNLLNKEKKNQRNVVLFLFVILGLTIILLVSLYWFYRYKAREKIRSHEQEMLTARLEIQEQIFKNISQEIHDNIGQALTLAKLNINSMSNCDSNDMKEKIYDTKELVSKAIQDLRDLSKSLNKDFVEDMGLLRSIENELCVIKKISGIEIKYENEGEIYSLSNQKELILFRIVQEALNNIMKHAKASLVKVVVTYLPESFRLEITDNGDGFDIDNINNQPNEKLGLGLRNMKNRSQIIGATYSINSEPGKGTSVLIELPVS